MPKQYDISLTDQIAKTITTVNLLIQNLCALEGMLKDLKDATRQPASHQQPQIPAKSAESIFLSSEENIKEFLAFVQNHRKGMISK